MRFCFCISSSDCGVDANKGFDKNNISILGHSGAADEAVLSKVGVEIDQLAVNFKQEKGLMKML
jgi:hypothetical protein